jgi:hypothetical protein
MSAPRDLRDSPIRSLLVAGSWLFVAYLFVQILMFRYGRDQGIYATVAAAILRGGTPYRDAWDFKPPGIYAVYAVTRALLGAGQGAIRVVEVLGLAGVAAAFVVLSRRFWNTSRPGIFGAALAVLAHAELEFWHTAQPESFGGMLTVWALVLATYEVPKSHPHRQRLELGVWVAAGALYGAAFLLKPPLGGGAVISAYFVARRLPRRLVAIPFLAMATGSAVVISTTLLWFAARGALGELYQVLFVFTPHYTQLSWQDATVSGMVYLAFEEWLLFFSSGNAAGILAALILRPIAPREREGVVYLLLVIAVQLVGVAMQGKFFPYHYGASIMLGSLIAGLGVEKLWNHALARGWLGIAIFAFLLPFVLFARSATRDTESDFLDRCSQRQRALLGLSEQSLAELNDRLYSAADVSYGADRKVADYLRQHLAPEQSVYIWGFEPMIYDMSGRRPASRYIYDVPQRVAWARDAARGELMTDLIAHPPGAVVVEHRDVFPAVTGDAIDSADSLRSFPAFSAWLADGYQLAVTIEDFDVYLPRLAGTAADPAVNP